jgi:hypothetical protein
MNIRSGIKSILLLVCCCYALSACAADTIAGKVRNQTTQTPAAGDDVILLRLGEGMEEQERTRTDAEGAFGFQVAPDARHIVRVLHQGVNYDQTVNGASSLEITVFDAVAKIPDVSGNLGIARLEADGQLLKITEMYAISNNSNPPVTQAGPHNFVFSMPPKASLDSFMVKKAGAVWVNVTPSPIPAQKDRYAVDFPLRPGDTLFKYVYHLPYDGHATLHLKLAYPIRNFGVIHPPTMSFKATSPRTFASPGLVQGLQLEQAVSKPVVREVPAFEISGVGTVPPVATEAMSLPSPASAPAQPATTSPKPESAASFPAAPNESTNALWIVLSGTGAVLTAVIFGIWRRRKSASTAAPAAAGQGSFLVDALKEELFQLEAEKLHGSISAEQYDSTKQALHVSIQRAQAKVKS